MQGDGREQYPKSTDETPESEAQSQQEPDKGIETHSETTELNDTDEADEGETTQPVSGNDASKGSERVAENTVDVLQNIIPMMGYEAEVVLQNVQPEEVNIDLQGEDAGDLIGRHGVTLDALQLITAIIANRDVDDGARVVVDAEGYRDRREQMLEDMAYSHAQKAKEAVKEVVIRDLKAYERRIVHLALADDPDVETYSEGEGSDRQLVISPTG